MNTPVPTRLSAPGFSVRQPDAEQRQWLEAAVLTLGITATQLAREAGLDPSTVTRFLGGGHAEGHILSFRTMRKLQAAVARLSNATRLPGLREEAEPFVHSDRADAIAAAVRVMIGGRNACDPWQVTSDALEGIGLHKGDILVVDLNEKPLPGDIVCAQLYDQPGDGARTVFRLFEPPFLLSNSMARSDRKPAMVDTNATIRGVVIGRITPRFSASGAA